MASSTKPRHSVEPIDPWIKRALRIQSRHVRHLPHATIRFAFDVCELARKCFAAFPACDAAIRFAKRLRLCRFARLFRMYRVMLPGAQFNTQNNPNDVDLADLKRDGLLDIVGN